MDQQQAEKINEMQAELTSIVKPNTAFAVFDYIEEDDGYPAGDELAMSIVSVKANRFINVTKGYVVVDQTKQTADFERMWVQSLTKPARPDRQQMLTVKSTAGARLFSPRAGKLRVKHEGEEVYITVGRVKLDVEFDDVVATFKTSDIKSLVFEKARYTGFDMEFGSVKPGDCLLRFHDRSEPVKFRIADRGPTGLPVMTRANHGPIWDLPPEGIGQVYREVIECAKAAYANDAPYGRIIKSYFEMDGSKHDQGLWVNYGLRETEKEVDEETEKEVDEELNKTAIAVDDEAVINLIPADLVNEHGRAIGVWSFDLTKARVIMDKFRVLGAIPYGSSGKIDFGLVKARIPTNRSPHRAMASA